MMLEKFDKFYSSSSRDVRQQACALCYKIENGKPLVLIMTSTSGRWIFPKGWLMEGKSEAETALQEAFEEAGVVGKIDEENIGHYRTEKHYDDRDSIPVEVSVHSILVAEQATDYPEAGERDIAWLSVDAATSKLGEPALGEILKDWYKSFSFDDD